MLFSLFLIITASNFSAPRYACYSKYIIIDSSNGPDAIYHETAPFLRWAILICWALGKRILDDPLPQVLVPLIPPGSFLIVIVYPRGMLKAPWQVFSVFKKKEEEGEGGEEKRRCFCWQSGRLPLIDTGTKMGQTSRSDTCRPQVALLPVQRWLPKIFFKAWSSARLLLPYHVWIYLFLLSPNFLLFRISYMANF